MRRLLQLTFWLKILLTVGLVALPLLVLPNFMIEALGLGNPMMVKLVGVAYLGLSVAYWHGLNLLREGRFPSTIAAMGIVSNAGAAAVIAHAGLNRGFYRFADWLANSFWAAAFATGAIALLLLVCVLTVPRVSRSS